MADATLAEMTVRVAEKLFILTAGETVDAEDSATIQKVIVSTNEKLREKELCYWADSATPQHLVEDLASYYGCHLANDYMDANEAVAFKTDPETGTLASLREIRSLVAQSKRVRDPTRMVPF